MKNNRICDSSTDTSETWHGLSPFGKEVVQEMNRIGMLVDVSHISDNAFFDVIKISKSPVVASHSCCRAICNSPRNLSDEMLKALKENGGVIQINFFSGYLDEDYSKRSEELTKKTQPEMDSINQLYKDNRPMLWQKYREVWAKYPNPAPSIEVLINHIDHVVRVIGVDHVGFGSDFDGISSIPRELVDVSKLPWITYHLLKRGYTETDIKKILGGNFLRVWEKNSQLAKESSR
jgi:membrane dipeptidase